MTHVRLYDIVWVVVKQMIYILILILVLTLGSLRSGASTFQIFGISTVHAINQQEKLLTGRKPGGANRCEDS